MDQMINQKLLTTLLRDFFEIEDPAFLETVSGQLALVELPAGAALFRHGDMDADVYFLIHGRLRALVPNAEGEMVPMADIAPGETVGEQAFLGNSPRDATIFALRASTLIRMSCEQFEQTLRERPQVAISVMRSIAARAARAQASRRLPVPAQTICIIPITDNVDALGFAGQFFATRQASGENVKLLSEQDPVGTRSAPSSHHQAALQPNSFIMVANHEITPWSQTCIGLADEIVLLANPSSPPDLSAIEAILPQGQEFSSVDRTLVLLHPPGTQNPAGTANWLRHRRLKRHIHVRLDHAADMRRCTRLLTGRAVGVVLSGGGARGLAHIGVLKALAEAGIEIDLIGGASIGAIIGTLHAMELHGDAMHKAATRAFIARGNPVGDYNFLPLVSLSRGQRAKAATESIINETLGENAQIEDCWINLFLITTDYSASAETVLTHGPLIKSILASYAIPGVLPPIIINKTMYIDGGTVNNMPIDVMERQGARQIIAVDVSFDRVHTYDFEWMPSPKALLRYRLGRMFGRKPKHRVPSITEIMLKSSFISASVRQRNLRNRADLSITPPMPRIRFLDWKKLDLAIEEGFTTAQEQLATLPPPTLARLQGGA